MNKKLWKLIWFGAPLTKVVYAFLAYSNRKEIDNSFQMVSLLVLIIGLAACALSILLSRKIYQKNFYENKLVKSLIGSPRNMVGSDSIFVLFTMLIGLAETAALFAFVQYILTGNLIVGCILYVFSLTAWAFNYPSDMKEEEQ